jgi:hypothetical protein
MDDIAAAERLVALNEKEPFSSRRPGLASGPIPLAFVTNAVVATALIFQQRG